MKSNGTLQQDQGEEICPKRLWVLTALSNDELLDQGEPLPQGLQFHLSRCEPCRQLADRLLLVTSSLGEISELESPADLASRADVRAIDALRTGAKLTGRVAIPDEPDVEFTTPGRALWLRFGRVAAAAAIVFCLCLWGAQQLSHPPQGALVEDRPGRNGESSLPALETLAVNPDAGPQAGEPKRLADSRPEEDALRALRYPVRRYATHYEAALADDPGSVQAAFPHPRRRVGIDHQTTLVPTKRWAVPTLHWSQLFDRPAPIESITPSSNER